MSASVRISIVPRFTQAEPLFKVRSPLPVQTTSPALSNVCPASNVFPLLPETCKVAPAAIVVVPGPVYVPPVQLTVPVIVEVPPKLPPDISRLLEFIVPLNVAPLMTKFNPDPVKIEPELNVFAPVY